MENQEVDNQVNVSLKNIYNEIKQTNEVVRVIRNWVVLMGVITLLTLLFSLIGGCSALL